MLGGSRCAGAIPGHPRLLLTYCLLAACFELTSARAASPFPGSRGLLPNSAKGRERCPGAASGSGLARWHPVSSSPRNARLQPSLPRASASQPFAFQFAPIFKRNKASPLNHGHSVSLKASWARFSQNHPKRLSEPGVPTELRHLENILPGLAINNVPQDCFTTPG